MKSIRKTSTAILAFAFFAACAVSVFAQGATLTGKVAFEGEAPKPAPINFGAEKQCADMHKDKMPVNEDIVINSNNTVKSALIYIKEGATGTYTAPADPVVIDQTGCMFVPHAVGAMAGQKVIFKNNDPVLHNVRTDSKINKVFNIAQPIQGMETKKTFAQPEIGIHLKCDVHFWMAGYIHVLANPYFAITGDDGTFTIKDLPAGTYTVELWHEKLGVQDQTITVKDGETKAVDFTLKKA